MFLSALPDEPNLVKVLWVDGAQAWGGKGGGVHNVLVGITRLLVLDNNLLNKQEL